MKKYFSILLLIPLLSLSAKEWVRISPDNHTSISFPAIPDTSTEGLTAVWKASDAKTEKGSSISCIFSTLDLSKMGMTAERMATDLNKPNTIKEFGTGVLNKFKGGKILSEKQTAYAGYPAFEYVIRTGAEPASHLTLLHSRVIFLGTMMYNLSFYESPSKPQELLRKRFFNSFTIKP